MARFLLALLALLAVDAASAADYFPLRQVRLLDSPFQEAQDRDIEYILALEPDRLLAPYLTEAGLEPKAEHYGNWEGEGLNGHMGGHYLSALSLAYAATGRKDVLERLDYMLSEMRRAQEKNGNGYLGGVPGSHELWQQVAKGEIHADLFGLNGAWVPWYNLHKVFAGLRDAWLYAGSEQAKQMFLELAGWALNLASGLSDAQIQDMLTAEQGGMNEVLADAAAISGDPKYLKLAERFSHRKILDPLLAGKDELTGLHANTQIPKVIGFERIAELARLPEWHQAAEFFWNDVVNERSVAIGGNSVREHFNPRDDFEPMIRNVEGPETCNTYNMLKLTRMLYGDSPDLKYVRYYERALYNHILSTQDPDTGGLVYFTPMRPQHYRVYSQPQLGMWCCVGTGIENHVKYGAFIYAHDGDALYVNLYIPSKLEWPQQSTALRQENRFPDGSSTRIVFESDSDIELRLRYPAWAAERRPSVKVNGEAQDVSAAPGEYIVLRRQWKKGDSVSLELPMKPGLEQMPGGSDYYAVEYGPIVLSAPTSPFEDEVLNYYADDSRMGHIPGGQLCPLERSPVLVGASPDLADRIERVDGDQLKFRIRDTIEPDAYSNLELIPFFRVHHTRYMLYWPFSTPEHLQARMEADAQEEQARLELERLTVDQVAPGEQQPESDHFYEGSGSEAGLNFGRHWRHATEWFGYRLNDPKGEGRFLRITYWGADAGRSFTIELGGIRLTHVDLVGGHGAEFFTVDYEIPDEIRRRAADGHYRLRFVADKGSIAGGIYGVRLLSALPQAPQAGD